ncbi:PAS domain S-box protein [Desulfohalovibrio reitneri]|uniref:PAS domain S-box protein n=1 Tax=Desulfohalovibrio reitneri TaxID=1307759 RepID=UPI00068BB2E6|nr:PAS domain S-box protein [Desulfohalovibrio reitneri]
MDDTPLTELLRNLRQRLDEAGRHEADDLLDQLGARLEALPDAVDTPSELRICPNLVLYRFDLREDRLDYLSSTVEELTGFPPDYYLGNGLDFILAQTHPEDRGPLLEKMEYVRNQAGEFGGLVPVWQTYRRLHKNGHWVWLADWANYHVSEHGELLGLTGTVYDVSPHKGAESALRLSEARFHNLFRGSPMPTLLLRRDRGGGFVLMDANPAAENLTRGGIPSLLGKSLDGLLGADHPMLEAVRRCGDSQEHTSHAGPHTMLTTGERRWLQATCVPVSHELVLVHLEDVTERREAERALREKEARYRLLAENTADVIFTFDLQGRFTYVSPSVRRILGYLPAEVLRLGFADVMLPETLDRIQKGLAERLRAERAGEPDPGPRFYEMHMRRADGSHVWCECVTTDVRDENGVMVGIQGVLRDISERKRMEEDLLRAKEQAEAASQAKSAFLANMSHEIRNPLHAVLGLAELLLEDELPPEQRERAEMLQGSASSLLGILGDVLDNSKIEAGKLELEPDVFDPAELVRAVAAEQRVQASSKGVGVSLFIDPRLPGHILSDPGRLRQILVNLAGNAVKFTDEGYVEIIARRLDDGSGPDGRARLLFAVADTGEGVPRGLGDEIFDSFAQAEHGQGGTGLGLAICKGLAELFEGSLWYESTPGKGSVFCFSAPFAEVGALPEAGADGRAAETTPSQERLHVLVVEDDWTNRRFACQLLQRRGHRVSEAENGRRALEILAERPMDLVLMDLRMPGLGGLETTRAIRRGERGCDPATQIVGLTAHASRQDREACLRAGMDGYLAKPLRLEKLYRLLGRVSREKARNEGNGAVDFSMARDLLADEDGASFLLRFLEDADKRCQEARRALARGEPRVAREEAHSLAGACLVVGAADLHAACRRLEEQLDAGGQGAVELADDVCAACRRTRRELEALLD